jgi:hypothetical protein
MAIQLGKKTILTTEVEKAFVEIREADPNETLTENQLREGLPKAIGKIGDRRSSILRIIYRQHHKPGKFPSLG